MMRLWDYATCSCGKDHSGWPIDAPKIPKTIACECGKRVGWMRGKQNHLHQSKSSLYGKKDPRFGVTFADKGEKDRYLKEKGIIEGDIEREDDILGESDPKKTKRDPNMLVADSLEDLQAQIGKTGYDRQNTGSLTGRDGQDKETGLIDSWRTI